MIKTGVYEGNGIGQNIDIGVDLASKKEVLVIVKNGTNLEPAVYKTNTSFPDMSYPFSADVGDTQMIDVLTNTGFHVGTNNNVNEDTVNHYYTAIWQEG